MGVTLFPNTYRRDQIPIKTWQTHEPRESGNSTKKSVTNQNLSSIKYYNSREMEGADEIPIDLTLPTWVCHRLSGLRPYRTDME